MNAAPLRFALTLLALLALGSAEALAQYDYGGASRSRSGGRTVTEDTGWVVFFEAGLTNPRNADNVVATDISGAPTAPIIPSWDDDFSGKLGAGYGWASGNRISVSFWSFDTDTDSSGSGSFAFAIGPPITDGSDFFGDTGGWYSATTEMEATTFDVAWGIEHQMIERLTAEWSLGVRYALFEETQEALYDEALSPTGVNSYSGIKENEGEMIGVRATLRLAYRVLESISIGGGMGFSFLDGELTASSTLRPTGSANSGLTNGFSSFEDDGRSGRITDLDARVTWYHSRDIVRVWLAWEQSEWEDIAADVMRNFPGTVAPLRERDSVTFSSFKLGVRVRF